MTIQTHLTLALKQWPNLPRCLYCNGVALTVAALREEALTRDAPSQR